MNLPCPAYGFLSLTDACFGSYNLCDVCGWEDDGVQLANPAGGGGANTESLIAAQAKSLTKFPLGLVEACGYSRDSAWQPLSNVETQLAMREREEGYWRNMAVVDPADAYWMRRPNKA